MKNRKSFIYTVVAVLFLGFVPTSCTDLETDVYSELTGDTFFDNPENLISAFGATYTKLYLLAGHKFGLLGMDCGTDLLAVPQRHGDWFDGGEWHRWHRNTLTPSESYVKHWWNLCFEGVTACNRLIPVFTELGTEDGLAAAAELRAFRAVYYYWLIDLFGNVPIVDSFDESVDFVANNTRKEVYDFIEQEFLEVRDQLSKETGLATYGRVTYYVAQTFLAKLYMNAEVYTGTPQWDKAEAVLDDIIASQAFSIAPDYFDNFSADASLCPEVIFAVPFDQVNATGFEVHLFSLHYNLQEKFGFENLPWNGLCAQESLFNLFEEFDLRRNGLLFGKQYDVEGVQIEDPSYEKFNPADPTAPRDLDGAGLNLTPQINMLEPDCLRQAGARIAKWPFIEGSDRYTSNDFPILRYADLLLLKAEVLLRNGGDPGEAANLVNEVRARAQASTLGSATLDDIYNERARELFAEGHRRSDMIRFGTFYGARWEKSEVSEPCMNLWPIPESQLNVNANLKQNDCY